MARNIADHGAGLGEKAMQPALGEDPLGGTGGSVGGGTVAGDGEPAGGATDDALADKEVLAAPANSTRTKDREIALEAAALGQADGSLADAADAGRGAETITLGDAIDSGSGRDVGSGTPSDSRGIGGGEPLTQQGGNAPAATRSPSRESGR